MAANTNRFSTYTTASADSKDGEKKKDMWNSMLESVASGKRLPEKNLLVLGGTVETQRSFLESLSSDFRKNLESDHIPPVANHFALGNTFYDVLDADQEDILARISFYSLTKPSATFSSLIRPLLTPQTIPNTLVVVLLDWSQPWLWMRQLREWILLLRTVLLSLSIEAKDVMEEVMISWRDRGRGGAGTNLDGSGVATAAMSGDGGGGSGDSVALPMGPGEWEDALGLPLSVVCQNADKIDGLEKRQGWKEEQFDLVMQFMRTILLKHGASLIYTSPSAPSQLPILIHSSLGITSLLKRQALKHNVIDRDKIVVPPNWDSWGKIRVLRDGFDVEKVSEGWSIDLDQPFPREPTSGASNSEEDDSPYELDSDDDGGMRPAEEDQDVEGSTVTLYEQKIENPSAAAQEHAEREDRSGRRMEVETEDHQAFLDKQYPVMDEFRKALQAEEDDEAATKSKRHGGDGPTPRAYGNTRDHDDHGPGTISDALEEQIGSVSINMGGIQMDPDAAYQSIQRLTERQHAHETETEADVEVEVDEGPTDPDRMQAFFAGLIQRGMAKSGGT